MNLLLGAMIAKRRTLLHDGIRRLRAQPRVPAALLLAAIAIVDIAALPSAHSSASTPAASGPTSATPEYRSALAEPVAPAEPGARRFTGTVGLNLSDAMLSAGVPERQGREYVAVLAHAIRLANGLSVRDRFDLVIEQRPDGSFDRLLYVGLDRIARADVELMKWTDGKQVIWVNGDGAGGGEGATGMVRPVSGRITSGFGERFHPILGELRFHKGVDLGAAAGSPIVAAADGQVVFAGWHGGYGKQIAIAHEGGLRTTYGHMSRIAAYKGESVRRGQVIGFVGSTGLSTGPHLHFEVTKDGRPLNPLSARFVSGPATLQGEKLVQFHNELRQILLAPGRG